MKRLISVAIALGLTGCGDGGMDDLRAFVAESGKDMQGKIEPLPQIKAYEPFAYDAFDLPDPFKPRKLSIGGGGGGMQPDLDRPKEPLESYALETLKMVGAMSRQGVIHAVVKTSTNAIYHVKKGNYIGQNFGMITQITDSEVTLHETIQDSAGDWTERVSTLILQE
ncbi:MAG: type pilus assembly protein PilP [Pseudomonadota bacterium]|nr:type pilus assembly protein PilP [Pseudomonadota bacterium]